MIPVKKTVIILLVVVLAAAGITAVLLPGKSGQTEAVKEVNLHLTASGLALGMKESEANALLGEFERQPCILGYENFYSTEALEVAFDAKSTRLRRLITKNPAHTVYGLEIGTDCDQGRLALTGAGYAPEGDSRYKYVKENVRVTLMSLEGSRIDGFTVETIQ